MKKYKVSYESNVLGNGSKIMTAAEIKEYNLAAYVCLQKVLQFGGKKQYGMWTVEEIDETNDLASSETNHP